VDVGDKGLFGLEYGDAYKGSMPRDALTLDLFHVSTVTLTCMLVRHHPPLPLTHASKTSVSTLSSRSGGRVQTHVSLW
jgi:hypothetical protein